MSGPLDELRAQLEAATDWHDGEPTPEAVAAMTLKWETTAVTDHEKAIIAEVFSYTALKIWEDTRREMFGALDAFAEAHPGLVDRTQHCSVCGKPMWDAFCELAEEIGGVDVRCSDCAAARKDPK